MVRLLPKSEWQSRSTNKSTATHAESADSMSDAVATGTVVGILSRRDREYVASFDVSFNFEL